MVPNMNTPAPRSPQLADAEPLAKAPDARWQTAVGFGEAIQRASGTTAPEAVPPFDVKITLLPFGVVMGCACAS